MKLKANNGVVVFQMQSGKDFVQNTMSEKVAKELIANGEVTESDRPDFPICVNGKFYFRGEEESVKVGTEPEVIPFPEPVKKNTRNRKGGQVK